MHGRIFVIDTPKDFQRSGELYSPPWDESDMVSWIPGCDYVAESEDFETDCKWFADAYNLDGYIQKKEVTSLGEKRSIYEVDIAPLMKSLMEEERRRIEEIKQELVREKPDLWRIHQVAWTDSAFWFAIANGAFEPEMGLLEFLRGFKEEGIERVWIVGSYDYHI